MSEKRDVKLNKECLTMSQYRSIIEIEGEIKKIFGKEKKENDMEKIEKKKLYQKGDEEKYFSDVDCTNQLIYENDGVFLDCITGEEFLLDEYDIVKV